MEKKCSLSVEMDHPSDSFLHHLALPGLIKHSMLLILKIKGFVVSDYQQIKKKAMYF
jgi:hypothetical protein